MRLAALMGALTIVIITAVVGAILSQRRSVIARAAVQATTNIGAPAIVPRSPGAASAPPVPAQRSPAVAAAPLAAAP